MGRYESARQVSKSIDCRIGLEKALTEMAQEGGRHRSYSRDRPFFRFRGKQDEKKRIALVSILYSIFKLLFP